MALSNLGVVLLQGELRWSNFQPVQSIALELPVVTQSSAWALLTEMDYEQAGAMTSHLRKALQEFKSKNSYIFAKGSHVISKHSAPGITLDDFMNFLMETH